MLLSVLMMLMIISMMGKFLKMMMFFFLLLTWFYTFMTFFDGILSMDFLSSFMMFITVWSFFLSINAMTMSSLMNKTFLLMTMFSILSFLSSSALAFYISFEFIFIMMFVFLMGWGKTPERLQATFYMFFYTMSFSLPFLVMLISFMEKLSIELFLMSFFSYNSFLVFFLFCVFVVKLPLFGFHMWLPKAHVEAPVSGSMTLAGVLLKLGGYGLIRFSPSLMVAINKSTFLDILLYISLGGGLYLSILCSRQMDMKMIIAFSSVVHMSMVFLGIFSFSSWGLYGAILMMVAHGLASPLMFFLMNSMYKNFKSRSLMMIKGLMMLSPSLCMAWFISCIMNLSVPPFMSFFSEICIMGSLSILSVFEWALLAIMGFFTGLYSILLYTSAAQGNPTISSLWSYKKDFFIAWAFSYFICVFFLSSFFIDSV